MLIDWFTVAAQVINFLILIWLLKRFLYKPVLTAIDAREKRIAEQIQNAEKKKAEALREQVAFQHKNEEFEQQRVALLAEATNTAKSEREKLIAAARQDAEALHTKLEKVNDDEFESLNRKVGTFAQKEVFSLARKVLTDLAGMNLEERIAEVFVRRLHDMNDKQRDEFKGIQLASAKSPLVRTAFALSDPQRAGIAEALKPLVGEETKIDFETKPELISGIELIANGQKIAWSISDYLGDLTAALGNLLESKSSPAPLPPKVLPHAA
jgi:F-type H+-transporting ATPase subunit b